MHEGGRSFRRCGGQVRPQRLGCRLDRTYFLMAGFEDLVYLEVADPKLLRALFIPVAPNNRLRNVAAYLEPAFRHYVMEAERVLWPTEEHAQGFWVRAVELPERFTRPNWEGDLDMIWGVNVTVNVREQLERPISAFMNWDSRGGFTKNEFEAACSPAVQALVAPYTDAKR